MMPDFTKSFEAISKNDIALVGGKGANLGEMAGAGFPVPPGFCVTTDAYHAFIEPFSAQIYTPLEGLDPVDLNSIRAAGATVRALMAEHDLPTPVAKAIVKSWKDAGQKHAYAVRSSATAEDLPTASFAGQQDTYLNVIGEAAILTHVKSCFISLFTDRAILYRIQNGFPHELVALSAVVQRMVMKPTRFQRHMWLKLKRPLRRCKRRTKNYPPHWKPCAACCPPPENLCRAWQRGWRLSGYYESWRGQKTPSGSMILSAAWWAMW